jgi:hypothetical protein
MGNIRETNGVVAAAKFTEAKRNHISARLKPKVASDPSLFSYTIQPVWIAQTAFRKNQTLAKLIWIT